MKEDFTKASNEAFYKKEIKELFDKARERHRRWDKAGVKVDWEKLSEMYEGWV